MTCAGGTIGTTATISAITARTTIISITRKGGCYIVCQRIVIVMFCSDAGDVIASTTSAAGAAGAADSTITADTCCACSDIAIHDVSVACIIVGIDTER